MTPDDLDHPNLDQPPARLCPLTGVMDVLTRRYAMQIVCTVGAHGTARFSDVEAGLPHASTSTLSARLDELAAAGLLARTAYDEVPPRVEYELTDDGRELSARLLPLLSWVAEREGLTAPEDGDEPGAFDLGAFVEEVLDLLDPS